MCSCLFIIGDVLPFAGTMKKKDREENFKVLLQSEKVKNMWIMFRKLYRTNSGGTIECVLYNFSNVACIFLCTIFLNTYICKETE